MGLERRLQSHSQTHQSYRVFIAESLRLLPGHPVLHVAVASLPAVRPTVLTTHRPSLTHEVNFIVTFPVVPGVCIMPNLSAVLWPRGVVWLSLPPPPVGEQPVCPVRPEPALTLVTLSVSSSPELGPSVETQDKVAL